MAHKGHNDSRDPYYWSAIRDFLACQDSMKIYTPNKDEFIFCLNNKYDLTKVLHSGCCFCENL